jgi:hypothetical protein
LASSSSSSLSSLCASPFSESEERSFVKGSVWAGAGGGGIGLVGASSSVSTVIVLSVVDSFEVFNVFEDLEAFFDIMVK